MNRYFALALSLSVVSLLGACDTAPLPQADTEIGDIVLRISEGENVEDSVLAPDLERLNELLMEAYEGHMDPIPENEIVETKPYVVPSPIDAFRYGVGLSANSLNEGSVGALVARPISIDYDTMMAWSINGNWAEIYPRMYREYVRVYEDEDDLALIEGSFDEAYGENDVINLAGRGIVFDYHTTTHYRRVKGLDIPGNEALVHWEFMAEPAERIEGGYNAYLTFLRNMEILYPVSSTRAIRVGMGWSIAGGSAFFINGDVSSGDIGEGIRRVLVDLEDYIANQ